jgi:hypothetical protein
MRAVVSQHLTFIGSGTLARVKNELDTFTRNKHTKML